VTAVRPARPGEAARLTEIAHAAKRHWGYPEAWMDAWRDALTLTPEHVARWHVRVAQAGDAIAGFHAVSVDGDAAALEHLWIDPPLIGSGLGRLLFDDAVRTAAEHGARELVIDSDPHAEGFYLRMGARRIGEVPADVDGAPRTLPRLRIPIDPA
jgi:GNAT superfamily N-acetyltransferase